MLGGHLGDGAAAFAAAPFSLPDEDELRALLAVAFTTVSITRFSVRTAHPSSGAFAAAFLRYLPDDGRRRARGRHRRRDGSPARPWQVGGPLLAPIVSHLAICR